MYGNCEVFADSCWAILPPLLLAGGRFGHFPVAFPYPLRIGLGAFPSAFSIPF